MKHLPEVVRTAHPCWRSWASPIRAPGETQDVVMTPCNASQTLILRFLLFFATESNEKRQIYGNYHCSLLLHICKSLWVSILSKIRQGRETSSQLIFRTCLILCIWAVTPSSVKLQNSLNEAEMKPQKPVEIWPVKFWPLIIELFFSLITKLSKSFCYWDVFLETSNNVP